CGTPEYMAPEQARAEQLDGRADLYAAAVILYQMVTGDIPFRADSPMAIVSRHLVETAVPPSKRRPDLRLPKIVDDVVMRGLEKEREMRYPTALAFREVLEGVLGATSGPATPVAPSVRASSPAVRDISGHDLTAAGARGTGTVPLQSPADKFGTTTNLTGRPRRQTPIVVAGIATLAAVSIAGAVYTYKARIEMKRADQASVAAIEAARATPLPPAAKPAPAPTPSAAAPAPVAAHEPATHEHGKHHHTATAPKPNAMAAPSPAPAVAAPAPVAAP